MPTIFRHKVICNGIAFNDPAALPAGALAWGVDVLDGWKNGPDIDEVSTPLGPNRDGSSLGDFFPAQKRYVIASGYVHTPSEAAAETLADLLARDVFPRNKDLTLVRYEAVPKFINVRRATAIEYDWTLREGFRWQTTLVAEDPLKYGLTPVLGSAGVAGQGTAYKTFPITFPFSFTGVTGGNQSSAGVNNLGTAPSPNFTATLTGILSAGAWRLRNDTNDGEISLYQSVGINDSLVIDFRNEVALLNGYPVGATLSGDFFALEPGPNTIRLYAEYDPGATVTINGYSAWE